MGSGIIVSQAQLEESIRDANTAVARNDVDTVRREWMRLVQVDKTLKTPEVQARISSFIDFIRSKEKKVMAAKPPAMAPAPLEQSSRRRDHRIVPLPDSMDIGKRMERERASYRATVENRAKGDDSPSGYGKAETPQPAKTGLELKAEKKETRELELIHSTNILPEDLLPQGFPVSDPKAKAIVSACKKLLAVDASDAKAVLACVPELARACLKYSSKDIFTPRSILFTFSIRRNLSDDVREKINDQLVILLDTDDKDLEDADTDEMVDPDESDLKEVEEEPVDENFNELLEEDDL